MHALTTLILVFMFAVFSIIFFHLCVKHKLLILLSCFLLELYRTIHRQAPSRFAPSGATCVHTCCRSQWNIDSLYLDGKASTANAPFLGLDKYEISLNELNDLKCFDFLSAFSFLQCMSHKSKSLISYRLQTSDLQYWYLLLFGMWSVKQAGRLLKDLGLMLSWNI